MNKLILDGHKLQWHRDRVEAWLAGARTPPITIDIALSVACNYHCKFCYGTLQTGLPGGYLPRDVVMNFLDDAAEVGVKAVSFISDGESTCNPHLYEAILRGKNNGLDIAMATNGYLLKEDRLEDILPSLTYLRFTFSAGTPDRYAEIHGVKEQHFYKVCETIKKCVEIKRKNKLDVTLGLQMVLIPGFDDQIIPLAKLGNELNLDYTIIKHCSDDELGTLGIDYSWYLKPTLHEILKTAEKLSTDNYTVGVKWKKILAGNRRSYSRCYGPRFLLQLSGSGIAAPCGMFFSERYKKFWIGNIKEQRFRDLVRSDRYWEVMDYLASDKFDAKTECGCLCIQDLPCRYLDGLKKGERTLEDPVGDPPAHVNFI